MNGIKSLRNEHRKSSASTITLKNKLAHYAKDATDIEYLFPFGWGEIEGSPQQDQLSTLSRHEEFSGKSMKYFDEETERKIYSVSLLKLLAGASRSFMAFLTDAYYEEEVNGEVRSVLKIPS